MTQAISRTELPLPLFRRGKVRDVYDLGDALLMVATDRVSAFDVVFAQPVPRKGEVLTRISAWWFAQTENVVPNHLLASDPDRIIDLYPELRPFREVWERRALLVRKLEPFPVECVVRGYISGSAWKEYAAAGTLAGEALPAGLAESGALESLIFSPATKAEEGHDENITFRRMEDIVGATDAAELRRLSLALYERGRNIAAERGVIIADTKFEFGRDERGRIRVMDEILTPDSSRFWPTAAYRPGGPQNSLDKQPLRDYLETLVAVGEWNKQPPGPNLPDSVLQQTSARYQDVYHRLTGRTLDEAAAHAGAT